MNAIPPEKFSLLLPKDDDNWCIPLECDPKESGFEDEIKSESKKNNKDDFESYETTVSGNTEDDYYNENEDSENEEFVKTEFGASGSSVYVLCPGCFTELAFVSHGKGHYRVAVEVTDVVIQKDVPGQRSVVECRNCIIPVGRRMEDGSYEFENCLYGDWALV